MWEKISWTYPLQVPSYVESRLFVNIIITVEPCFNKPLYIKVLGITNNIPIPSYSKIYGKKPQYNKLFF